MTTDTTANKNTLTNSLTKEVLRTTIQEMLLTATKLSDTKNLDDIIEYVLKITEESSDDINLDLLDGYLFDPISIVRNNSNLKWDKGWLWKKGRTSEESNFQQIIDKMVCVIITADVNKEMVKAVCLESGAGDWLKKETQAKQNFYNEILESLKIAAVVRKNNKISFIKEFNAAAKKKLGDSNVLKKSHTFENKPFKNLSTMMAAS